MAATTVGDLTAITLVHTCTISTRQQSATSGAPDYDTLGEAVATAYTVDATDVPCFARQGAGGGDTQEPGRGFVGQSWRVRLARGTTIGVDDQIGAVENAAGVSIVDGPLTVIDLLYRAGHVLAVCQTAALDGPVSVEEETP